MALLRRAAVRRREVILRPVTAAIPHRVPDLRPRHPDLPPEEGRHPADLPVDRL